MFKNLTIGTLLAATIFTGCGAITEDEVPVGKKLIETAAFQLLAPEAWEQINSGDFTSGVPQSTVMAIRSNIKNEIFTANLNISQTALDQEISSNELAKNTEAKNKTSLVDYKQISTTTNDRGSITIFSGRRSAADSDITFTQLYVVDKTTAYTVTAAALSTEEESVVKMLDEMIDSFSLK